MFSVYINDKKQFDNFLNSNDVEYVDVYLNDQQALFIMNTSEVFSALILTCTHSINEHGRGFRMLKSLLKQQSREGYMDVDFDTAHKVHVDFRVGDSVYCKVKFSYQQVFTSSYKDKLDLLKSDRSRDRLPVEQLGNLLKIANAVGGLFNISNGVASIVTVSNLRIYKEVKFQQEICISPKNLNLLRKCDTSIFSIANYVGAYNNNNFAILITKSRILDNSEYFSIAKNAEYRARYRVNLDFSHLLQFIIAHPLKQPMLPISLEERSCKILEDQIEYEIPLTFKSEDRAKTFEDKELNVPYSVVRNVLNSFDTYDFVVEKKQYFTQIQKGDYTILYS